MIVTNKKSLSLGVVLTITFFIVLAVFCSPVFNGQTGLQYADDLFNSISKGSAYFVPTIRAGAEEWRGTAFEVTVEVKDADKAEKAALLYREAGAEVTVSDGKLTISGDLGSVALAAVADAEEMYHNRGETLVARYGFDEREVLYLWWLTIDGAEAYLMRAEQYEAANFLGELKTRTIEAAYNYYGVEPLEIREFAGVVVFLLVFYVIYTMWWGFSVYYLFEGLGITMAKAKKAEV
jgi:hypothetical protein